MKSATIVIYLLTAFIPSAVAQKWDDQTRTPAEQKIAWAKTEIEQKPRLAQPFNDLAVALMDRARETGNAGYFDQAEAAVQSALKLDPGNYEALRGRAMVLLARRQYSQAIELARQLNARNPDDILTYGVLADGLIQMGDYDQALESVQWMMNLRAGNVPGLTRAAQLRWLHGEIDGSLSAYRQAYEEIPPMETEKRAWVLTKMADIQIGAGRLDEAEQTLQAALRDFPDYYLAMEAAARLDTGRKDYLRAVSLLRKRNADFPTLESRYELAQALVRAGEAADSKAAFSDFERDAKLAAGTEFNANRDLIFYELSTGDKPAEALALAESEAKKRHDAYTLDAYAWALYANGRHADAEEQIRAALGFGLRDAAMLFHAGAIEAKLQEEAAACRDLRSSLAINPYSEVAGLAQETLNQISARVTPPANGR